MIHIFTFNLFQEHTMVAFLPGRNDCLIVDPGFSNDAESAELTAFLEEKGLTPAGILLTHGHLDHMYGTADLQEKYGCKVWMNEMDIQELEFADVFAGAIGYEKPRRFRFSSAGDGMTINLAGFSFEVIRTPGHTEGGVCYLERDKGFAFTGDTLFAGTIGRTDFKYSDYDKLMRSITERLLTLNPDTVIYPGHGESSTIGDEILHNPMLEPFNEPESGTDEESLQPIIIHNVRR